MSGLKGISSTHQFFKRERLKKLKEAERHLAKSQRQLGDGGAGFSYNQNEGSEERVKEGPSKGKEMTYRSK